MDDVARPTVIDDIDSLGFELRKRVVGRRYLNAL